VKGLSRRKELYVADEKGTVSIPAGVLPDGMTAEDFVKLVTSYQEKRVKSKARSSARKEAIKTLIGRHQDEYDNLLKSLIPK
jgi:hypothetical protein